MGRRDKSQPIKLQSNKYRNKLEQWGVIEDWDQFFKENPGQGSEAFWNRDRGYDAQKAAAGWNIPRVSTPTPPPTSEATIAAAKITSTVRPTVGAGPYYTREEIKQMGASYWENPDKIASWYNKVQADPTIKLPDGMDATTLKGVYDYYKFKNDNKPPEQWKFLNPDDPMREFVGGVPTPGNEFLRPHEIARYGTKVGDIAKQTPGGTSETDPTRTDFDWTRLTVEQKKNILNDPNFSIAKVTAPGQQGLVLSEMFALNPLTGKNNLGPTMALRNLPWWQPVAYSVLSNPKTTPLVQGAALTVMTKGKGLALAIPMTLLGYGAQSEDENIRVTSEFFLKPFMWGAQTAEQLAGTAAYLTGGKSTEQIQPWQVLAGPLIGGGTALYKTIAGAKESDRLAGFIEDPKLRKAVWAASMSYYETKGVQVAPIVKVMAEFLPDTRQEGEVWILGENKPAPVQPGYTLDDAVQRALDGEGALEILTDYQRAYGITGVASDFMMQSVYDPLNVAPEIVGGMRKKGAEAAAFKATGEAAGLKELGALDQAQTERVAQLEGRARIETIKAEVFATTPAMSGLAMPWGEAGRKFKALVTAGLPAENAKYLTPWERAVAGVTPEGRVRELLPNPLGTTRVPKFIERLVTLQPKAKAKIFLEKFSTNIASLFDWNKATDASMTELMNVVEAAANGDMPTLKNMGAEHMGSPEAYTVIGAVRDIVPTLKDMATAYEAAGMNRDLFWQVQGVLGDEPRALLTSFLDGDPKPDFARLQDTLKASTDPSAKVLLDQITSGALTMEKLTEAFKPFKDGNVPIAPQEFMAKIINAMEDHMKGWGRDYFGLKTDTIFDDSLRLLKGAQSLLLLDLSPSAMVNDFLNERVMMATVGVMGLTPGKVVDAWIKEFGLTPKEAGYGLLGDMPKVEGDVVSSMTRGESPIRSMADAINKGRSYLLRPQASSRFNTAHAKQIYYKSAKTFWSRNWIEGKGFSKMPPGLEGRLREYGLPPELVYQNLRGVFDPGKLDILNQRVTTHDLNAIVDNAAKKLGKNPADISAMLGELGVDEALKAQLEKAKTPEQRLAAINSIEGKVMENFDIRQAAGLQNFIEQNINAIRMEGAPGFIKTMQDIPIDYYERAIDNDGIWTEAWEKSRTLENKSLRNQVIGEAARKTAGAYKRTQVRQQALYKAAFEGLGLDEKFKLDSLSHLSEEHTILQKFFEDRNAAAEGLGMTDFANGKAATQAWDGFKKTFDERFATDHKQVIELGKKRNALFVEEMRQKFGDPGAAMAKQWTDSVMALTEEIHTDVVNFRKFLSDPKNMPPEFGSMKEWHDAVWPPFKQDTLRPKWMERLRVDMEGSANLYKWDQNPEVVNRFIEEQQRQPVGIDAEKEAATYLTERYNTPAPDWSPVEKALVRGETIAPEELAQRPYLQAAFDNAAKEYPGAKIKISKADNLSPAQRVVEARFAEAINKDLDGAIDQYWKACSPQEANYLNVDYARELSPDYARDVQGRMAYAAAVQKPASALVRKMWEQKLAEPLTGIMGRDKVVFTAGGGGSGKSTATRTPEIRTRLQDAHVVWDMTLSESKDLSYIDQALSSGRRVQDIFVARDPIEALVGVAQRAELEGRVLPLDPWADSHSGSPETFRQAIDRYANNPAVELTVIDNTRGMGKAEIVPLEFMRDWVYNIDDLKRAGIEALRKGVQDGRIRSDVYEAITGDVTRGPAGSIESTATPGETGIRRPAIQGREQATGRPDGNELERQRFAITEATSKLGELDARLAALKGSTRTRLLEIKKLNNDLAGLTIPAGISKDLLANLADVSQRLAAESERLNKVRVIESMSKQADTYLNEFEGEHGFPSIESPEKIAQGQTPIYNPGGYEQATGYVDYSKVLLDGFDNEVRPVLDAMKESASRPESTYNFKDMDAQTQTELNGWLKDVRSKMASTKHMAKNYAEAQRDFAILDYSRQYGFDKPLSAAVPYEFFGTRSGANWLTRVVDRPAWISQYLRIMNLHNTYQSQLPERMRNKIFIPMPFLPEWAGGGMFIDPTYQLFPFKQFTQPLEAMRRDQANLANSAGYILRSQGEDGTITPSQAQEAMDKQTGSLWERAIAQAKQEQGENANTGADYFSMLLSPALYATIPYYLATGKKSGAMGWPSGQLPITKFGQGIETAFKGTPLEWAGNIAGNLAKPEKYAREALGLSEFGEWGDFYIDRQIANMVTEGKIDSKTAQMAMLERKGADYDAALQRVREELMLKVPGMAPLYGLAHGASLDKVIGAILPSLIPGGLLPPGEMAYKGLKQEYSLAWEAYKEGNKKALSTFFDEHPEYQARLALRRDPQERLTQFLRSEIWDKYTELGKTDAKQAMAYLGPKFQEFLDADPGVEFSTEQLALWSKMLNGMVPAVPETQGALQQTSQRIDYFAPEVTKVTDRFFNERKEQFPNYYTLQSTYYSLPRSEQAKFLLQFPEYASYVSWKKKYYKDFPELVPVFNGEVFRRIDTTGWPPTLLMMTEQAAYTGDKLPDGARAILAQIWENEGRPYDDLDNWIFNQVYPSILNQQMQGLTQ